MARGEILELSEAPDAGVERTFEGAECDLEGIAGVDHQRVRCSDQRIPVGRIDIDADLARRIGAGIAERDDFLFQPDFQPLERHRDGRGEFQFEIVEPAVEQGAMAQFRDEIADRLGARPPACR